MSCCKPIPECLPTYRLQDVALYLFFSRPEDEAAMAAWLAPLAVVRAMGTGQHLVVSTRGWWSCPLCSLDIYVAPATQSGLLLRPQLQHPDLGMRMEHALRHAFAAGHRRVAIVGTDVPDLTAGIVLQALQELDSHQVRFTVPAFCGTGSSWSQAGDLNRTLFIILPPFGALQAVFGPAEDGGYYLLALSSLPQALFEVRWV